MHSTTRRKVRRVLTPLIVIAAIGGTMLVGSGAALAAGNSRFSCATPTSPFARPGDDVCVVPAGTGVEMTGQDTYFGDENLVANDVTGKATQPYVTGVSKLDPSVAYGQFSGDTTGQHFFTLSIAPHAKPFSFTYRESHGGKHVVKVVPWTFRRPTVVKAAKPGYLKASEPTGSQHGCVVDLLYGSFAQPQPDGEVIVNPGHTVTFPVQRKTIDWEAFCENGIFLGTGRVRDITLAQAGVTPALSTATAPNAALWQKLAGKQPSLALLKEGL